MRRYAGQNVIYFSRFRFLARKVLLLVSMANTLTTSVDRTAHATATKQVSAVERNRIAARRIKRLANLMDDSITLPGTSFRVGWDGIVGLVPVVGDLATSISAGYVVVEAARAGVPKRALAVMLGRLGLDAVIGVVPVAGDVFDFVYKANKKNARTALKHLDPDGSITGTA